MLVNATLLIQDVQLLCFTLVFGALAAQRWGDRTRRWLWYSFLANAVGALLDLLSPGLPIWLGRGVAEEMIPLSYAVLNVAIICFNRGGKRAAWLSAALLAVSLPVFLAWQNAPDTVRSDALSDFIIAAECCITVFLLLRGHEGSTRAPRILMAAFMAFFVCVEFSRAVVVFLLHGNPDVTTPRLALISAVTYVVDVSLLPLAFIWMMQARSEWELLQQSLVDPLTGVLNRRGLEQALDRELARFRRYGQELTLAIVDLDHFKTINDKHGHPAGDTILRGVAEFLNLRVRKTDVMGRLGGEEFVLLFPHTDLARSGPLTEDLCARLRECMDLLPASGVRVTASFGVTSTRGRSTVAAGDLLREADVALYRAKEGGRDRVCYFKAPSWAVLEGISNAESAESRFAVN